jgi:hypothetical protein
MPIGRLVSYVTNISSHSKHYRKHAVVHSEVNANVLNRFIVFHFKPAPPPPIMYFSNTTLLTNRTLHTHTHVMFLMRIFLCYMFQLQWVIFRLPFLTPCLGRWVSSGMLRRTVWYKFTRRNIPEDSLSSYSPP